MVNLTQDQLDKQAAIKKSATTWGVIAGAIVGLLAIWILSGQGAAIRFGGAIVAGIVVGVLVGRASFSSQAKDAKCGKCGAAFSRSRTDKQETVTSSTPKEEREEQEDKSVKVTTWTEDKMNVVETFTCAKCGDITTNEYQTTRRRDEDTVTEAAPTPEGWARTTPEPAAEEAPKAPPAGFAAQTPPEPDPDPQPSGRSRSRGR